MSLRDWRTNVRKLVPVRLCARVKLLKERCPELEPGDQEGEPQAQIRLRWAADHRHHQRPLRQRRRQSLDVDFEPPFGDRFCRRRELRRARGARLSLDIPQGRPILGTGPATSIGSPSPPSQIGLRPGLHSVSGAMGYLTGFLKEMARASGSSMVRWGLQQKTKRAVPKDRPAAGATEPRAISS